MAHAEVYEGTPDQLVKQFSKLPKTRKYKVTVISEEAEATEKQSNMIAFGMFPQLQCMLEGASDGEGSRPNLVMYR